MSIALLDINDCNLQLWHEGTHVQSPGYALLVDKHYRFGNEARAAARLQPRAINTRFWWQLSTEALQPALGPARHTGDLVHAQLQELHKLADQPNELLIAVSGSMQREQLALLLGIIQQCPFEAVGLVNRSTLLGSLAGADDTLFHLEVQLHQSVITELKQVGNEVQLQRTVPLPGAGLLQIQEKLVEIIAGNFIKQTRFDPRRKAQTEQELYDELPAALRSLSSNSETNMEVGGYRARVNRAELQDAGQRLLENAQQAMGSAARNSRIIADSLAGLLPGLGESLAGVEFVASDAVRTAMEQHSEALVQRNQPLSFVADLAQLGSGAAQRSIVPAPTVESAPEEPPPEAEPARPAATHLLQGHTATPLLPEGVSLGAGCKLSRSAKGWQIEGAVEAIQVNDSPAKPGQTVGGGDRLQVGEQPQWQLIEVQP